MSHWKIKSAKGLSVLDRIKIKADCQEVPQFFLCNPNENAGDQDLYEEYLKRPLLLNSFTLWPFIRGRDNHHKEVSPVWVPVRSQRKIRTLTLFTWDYFQYFFFLSEAVFMSSPVAFHWSVCKHGIFSEMNPCAQVFSPSHLLFPADSHSWKNSCLRGLVVALQGPTWAPFGLSRPLLMSLSLILLPPAGQMFICEAADKRKKSSPFPQKCKDRGHCWEWHIWSVFSSDLRQWTAVMWSIVL